MHGPVAERISQIDHMLRAASKHSRFNMGAEPCPMQGGLMKRSTAILAVVIAAAAALAAVPLMAASADRIDTADLPVRTHPPVWVDQSTGELRDQIAKRAEASEHRIAASDRLTDEQKNQARASLADALGAIAAVDEPAEIVGTATSRRQLQLIEWRAIRRDVAPDFGAHIARDLAGDSRRFDHLTKIVGWARSAGQDVAHAIEFLDAASASLEAAAGNGTVTERHDAVHVARAWMTKALSSLMAD
jgi:hypothetical protein